MRRCRVILLYWALSCYPATAEWTLGITSFNNPKRLTLEAEPGTTLRVTAGTRRIVLPHGSTAGLLATGDEIDLFAQRLASTNRLVRITGFNETHARFTLRDGVNRRRYIGVLEVNAAAGILRLICRVPKEVAPPAHQPRHRGFDFCDQVHCWFPLQPGRR